MNKEFGVTFFLPTRKGSKRVKEKNTRRFAKFQDGLIELKLLQLIRSKRVDEIIVSSNDEKCLDIAERFANIESRIKIDFRPEYLCHDTTDLSDLIEHAGMVSKCEHIMWGHVTTPFADHQVYDEAIKAYAIAMINGRDSLVSVNRIQNFLLNKDGVLINGGLGRRWPRTQDLDVILELNHAVFLTSRRNYVENRDRIGNYVDLFEMNKIQSIDVDWEEDFLIAETLYEKFGTI